MSASEANISISLSPEPSADNYSHPFSRTQSHQSCLSAQLKPEELSAGPSQKRSTPRSGPVFNFTFDSSPPFFPLYHLSTPPSQPTYTVPVEFHSRANLYFQDNQRLDTHSFPMLQSGWLNGNWWFNFWNETQESFWNPLSPPAHPTPAWTTILLPPLSLAISVLVCWVQPISLLIWRRGRNGYCQVQLKKHHWLLPDTFSPSFITKLSSNKQTLKTKGFILSIAPSWMLCGNLKMIYANVISLCVIQRSQLMSELLQPNYKLARLDIIVRLMGFSGTFLIARRLRWG